MNKMVCHIFMYSKIKLLEGCSEKVSGTNFSEQKINVIKKTFYCLNLSAVFKNPLQRLLLYIYFSGILIVIPLQ
jgi:hypothetical protein